MSFESLLLLLLELLNGIVTQFQVVVVVSDVAIATRQGRLVATLDAQLGCFLFDVIKRIAGAR